MTILPYMNGDESQVLISKKSLTAAARTEITLAQANQLIAELRAALAKAEARAAAAEARIAELELALAKARKNSILLAGRQATRRSPLPAIS